MGRPDRAASLNGLDLLEMPAGFRAMGSAGFGLGSFGIPFSFVGLTFGPDSHPTEYTMSAGEVLASALARYVWESGLSVVTYAICFVSFLLGVMRLISRAQFSHSLAQIRKSLPLIDITDEFNAHFRMQKTPVYLLKGSSGTPFCVGWWRPSIWFTETSYRDLTREERMAVCLHERGHILHYDLVLTLFISLMGDVFWFVPGFRSLERRLVHLREILADRHAVESGAEVRALASAIGKIATQRFSLVPERRSSLSEGSPSSCFLKRNCRKASIYERIEALFDGGSLNTPADKNSRQSFGRFGWQIGVLRPLLFLVISGSLILSTFGGHR